MIQYKICNKQWLYQNYLELNITENDSIESIIKKFAQNLSKEPYKYNNILECICLLCTGNEQEDGQYNLFLDRLNTNNEKILELCKYLDINYDTILNKSFVGGTMFFGRTEIFQRHLDASITDILCQKLSIEAKHIEDKFSGKYSQSLERIFGYLVSINNLKIYPTINRSSYKIYGNYLQNRNPLHLHIISNNFCYIEEVPMLKGRVLDDNSSRITIDWCDHISHTQQEFTKLSNKHLIYKNV